ncbi:hypothetical protein WMY93_027010 [Mugilogobius chulae]|uniref:Dynein heavy chain linker domain-containing protein n=1 Tax=Mugilogobius chulae TaxID=88201 RepID=A0AAW0N3H6_9GOBI
MHTLVLHGVDEVQAAFQEQVGQTPDSSEIQNWNNQTDPVTEPSEEEDKDNTRAAVELTEQFKGTVLSVKALIFDEDLDEFTNMGEGHKDEKEQSYLESLLDSDRHLQQVLSEIKCICSDFQAFSDILQENKNLDVQGLRQKEHDPWSCRRRRNISQLYNLISTYSVPTPPEDPFVFASLKPAIRTLEANILDASCTEKDMTEKFNVSFKKDVKDLKEEIMKLDQKSQDKQILDVNADPAKVRLLLGEIQISVDELRARAATYMSYQKRFNVEVKFDSLDTLTTEVRLKQLLWDSLEEWDALQENWRKQLLSELDLEQLAAQVTKHIKYAGQLEKGLPRNSLVPSFREKVELMRSRLPVITDLRNPCIKSDHWNALGYFVGQSLEVDKLTIAQLEELDLFNYGPEIQEISGQASGEASVETLIKKVEDVWKNTNSPFCLMATPKTFLSWAELMKYKWHWTTALLMSEQLHHLAT